jgi:hypothetical protein
VDDDLFIEVHPDEVPNTREGRRGRVYYPIVKGFLESNKFVAKLNRAKVGNRGPQLLYAGLYQQIRTHSLPVKIFTRGGEIYLVRLDINEDGSPNPEWQAQQGPEADLNDIEDISADTVAAMVAQEQDSTK